MSRQGSNYFTKDAAIVRGELTKYFCSAAGRVSWQLQHICADGEN